MRMRWEGGEDEPVSVPTFTFAPLPRHQDVGSCVEEGRDTGATGDHEPAAVLQTLDCPLAQGCLRHWRSRVHELTLCNQELLLVVELVVCHWSA